MAQTVSAGFGRTANAEKAIGALQDHGIDEECISVAAMHPDTPVEPDCAEPATGRDGFVTVDPGPPTPTDMNAVTEARRGGVEEEVSVVEAEGKHGLTTTTPQDAARGAAEGSVAGLGVGLLAGVAALLVPGVGPVLAAGPLWTALAGALGATAAGALAGGVTGYLVDRGVPTHVAAGYARALQHGSVLVSVRAESEKGVAEARAILEKYGGTTITTY